MVTILDGAGAVLHEGPGNTLAGARLEGLMLVSASLRAADLRFADLRDATLLDATLGAADLRGADLRGADLEGADLRRANLRGANLRGANLGGANLGGASLAGANLLDAVLPNELEWGAYVTELVPALLTAGGRSLAEVAAHWACHDWSNCPLAVAFGADSLDTVPPLYRAEARLFLQLFDADLLASPIAQEE